MVLMVEGRRVDTSSLVLVSVIGLVAIVAIVAILQAQGGVLNKVDSNDDVSNNLLTGRVVGDPCTEVEESTAVCEGDGVKVCRRQVEFPDGKSWLDFTPSMTKGFAWGNTISCRGQGCNNGVCGPEKFSFTRGDGKQCVISEGGLLPIYYPWDVSSPSAVRGGTCTGEPMPTVERSNSIARAPNDYIVVHLGNNVASYKKDSSGKYVRVGTTNTGLTGDVHQPYALNLARTLSDENMPVTILPFTAARGGFILVDNSKLGQSVIPSSQRYYGWVMAYGRDSNGDVLALINKKDDGIWSGADGGLPVRGALDHVAVYKITGAGVTLTDPNTWKKIRDYPPLTDKWGGSQMVFSNGVTIYDASMPAWLKQYIIVYTLSIASSSGKTEWKLLNLETGTSISIASFGSNDNNVSFMDISPVILNGEYHLAVVRGVHRDIFQLFKPTTSGLTAVSQMTSVNYKDAYDGADNRVVSELSSIGARDNILFVSQSHDTYFFDASNPANPVPVQNSQRWFYEHYSALCGEADLTYTQLINTNSHLIIPKYGTVRLVNVACGTTRLVMLLHGMSLMVTNCL